MSELSIKNRKINSDLFFFVPVSCLFILSFLTYLNITDNTELFGYYAYQEFFLFFRALKPLFLAVLIIRIFLFSEYSKKQLLIIGSSLVLVFLLCRFYHPNYFLLYAVAACLAARNISYKTIAKTYLILALFTLFLTAAAYIYGLTSDVFIYRGTYPRHSLGLVHPNSLGMWALLITMYCLQYKQEGMKAIHYCLLAVFTVLIFLYTSSRASCAFAILAIFLSLLSRIVKSDSQNLVYTVCLIAIFSIAVLWILLVFIFDPDSSFFMALNKVSSYRLLFCYEAVSEHPVTLFGGNITFSTFVDPLFIYTLLVYGITGLSVFLAMFYTGAVRAYRKKLPLILIAILVFQLYNTQENVFLYHLFDITMFTATCDLD